MLDLDIKKYLQNPYVIVCIVASGLLLGFLKKIKKLPEIKELKKLEKYSLVIFNIINGMGMITKDLVQMNKIQAIELACLLWYFCFDLSSTRFKSWMTRQNIFEFFHHVLGSLGISMELYSWIGGGMMCWLLTDNVTNFANERTLIFWVLFFSIRVVGYTLIILKTISQSFTHAANRGFKIWLISIMIWGVYNLIYHAAWIYGSRNNLKFVIKRLLGKVK